MDEKMNTTMTGDKYELYVFSVIEKIIPSGNFIISPKCYSIFHKKGYYSQKRNKNIIFDISIEVSFPKSSSIDLLLLIECKYYSSSVPVNDIEEFYQKIDQVSGKNVKGIVFSNSYYDIGAKTFARNTGISLARMDYSDTPSWEFLRTTTIPRYFDRDLYATTIENFLFSNSKTESNCYSFANNCFYHSIYDLFFSLGLSLENKGKNSSSISVFPLIPFIDDEQFEAYAEKYFPPSLYDNHLLKVDRLIDYLKRGYSIEVIHNSLLDIKDNQVLLGKFDMKGGIIFINNIIEYDSPKWRFTLVHEASHFFLHQQLLSNIESFYDSDSSIDFYNSDQDKNTKRIEYQANHLASCSLLPLTNTFLSYKNILANEGITFEIFLIDDQRCNKHLLNLVLTKMALDYRASKISVEYRLKTLKLLIDNRHNRKNELLLEYIQSLIE